MRTVTLTKNRQMAYVLTKSDISRISGLLLEYKISTRIEVECGDDIKLHPSDIAELLDLSNTGERKITKIHWQDDYRSSPWDFSLEFSFRRYLPVVLEVKGPDDQATLLFKKVLEVVDSTRQWYSWGAVARQYTPFLTGISGGLFIACVLGIATGIRRDVALTWIAPAYMAMARQSIFALFFPVGIFEIGKGAEERAKFEKRRTFLFGGVGLAILVSILANAISHRLGF